MKNEEAKRHCHVPISSVAESTQKPEAVSRVSPPLPVPTTRRSIILQRFAVKKSKRLERLTCWINRNRR